VLHVTQRSDVQTVHKFTGRMILTYIGYSILQCQISKMGHSAILQWQTDGKSCIRCIE